ncbi:DUF6124 family protein [Pseudomonas fluorescens]|uniref:DUF3077 domain-containing protein n=1 Tax=Pseudomonas fluorescens TaxID=294 RepID=A0A5E7EQI4_PSEFL|nr:DUF3077 domain-containing protein [Pseudomonas fluorescens]VVO29078.1 hypothetical protein PS691_04793 [Pseudomonas fluorescens]
MSIPSNDSIEMATEVEFTSFKGHAAAQRALDYYLKPEVSESAFEEKLFDVKRGISSEEAMVHACGLLRCASATAHEAAEKLFGSNRDLAFSVVHMIDMAKIMVDRALDANRLD